MPTNTYGDAIYGVSTYGDPGPSGPGIGAPPSLPSGPTFTWIDYAGGRHLLSGTPNFEVIYGIKGAWTTEIDYLEDVIPGRAGAKLRGIKIKPRVLTLPMMIRGSSAEDLWAQLGNLSAWTDPAQGDGILEVTLANGVTKLLRGRAVLEIGDGVVSFRKAVLTVHAGDDPYWQSGTPTDRLFVLVGGTSFFNNGGPFFPLNLAADAILSGIQESNPGSVEAYPIWTLTGPGNTPAFNNGTETFALTYALAAGRSITIDTRPDYGTVVLDDGTSLIPYLTAASVLWTIKPGLNTISVTMTGASLASQVRLRYTSRWRSISP